MKRFIVLMLCAALMLSTIASATATQEEIPYNKQVGDLIYCVYDDHAEVVKTVLNENAYESYSIEQSVDGRPVTTICEKGIFQLFTREIIIPDTVTTIDTEAFYKCDGLQVVYMSQNIEQIAVKAFNECLQLRLVYWVDNIITLPFETKYGKSIFSEVNAPFIIAEPNGKVAAFVSEADGNYLPIIEGITYLTDGVCICSTKGDEARLLATYCTGEDTGELVVPDKIGELPVTVVDSDVYWGVGGHAERVYLGENVTVVEDGAFLSSYCIREIFAGRNVQYLPYPLFTDVATDNIPPAIYGYSNTYAERFAKEHDYPFYPIDSVPFEDVSKDDWYFDAVYYCYWTGLMKGNSHTNFAPNGTTTRAMVTQVLYNMSGAPEFMWEYGFKDVKSTDWFSKAVNWCRYYSLAQGTSAYYFSPNQNVTREQVAAFLYRYAAACGIPVTANGDLSTFNDAWRVSNYAKAPMRWAVEYGIINGQTATKLNPQGYATRAEIATMLMRFIKYVESHSA